MLFPIPKILHNVQAKTEVRCVALEIDVYLGRFFLSLNCMVAPGKGPSFATALFEVQDLNIDRSGASSSRFTEILRCYDRHGLANVTLIQVASTPLRHADLARYRGIPPKIVSVDIGHTAERTISTLVIAEAAVHDRLAMFLNDIPNPMS